MNRATESTRPAGAVRGQETILLVEDEPSVRALARTILERSGYTVLEAGIPERAIVLAESHPGPIHLLLTDVVMPQMNGPDLAAEVSRLRPEIRVLFMSGFRGALAAHGGADLASDFLQKPFAAGDLLAKVREILDRSAALG